MIRYATHFWLDGLPGDHLGGDFDMDEFNRAKHYLEDEEMVKYYDGPAEDKLVHIQWILEPNDEGSGFIVVDSKEPLTDEELADVSDFIKGQNSDGLGEGFEQNFSYYNDDPGDDWYPEYDDFEEFAQMCSFDWMNNDYTLYEYGTHYPMSFWRLVGDYKSVV